MSKVSLRKVSLLDVVSTINDASILVNTLAPLVREAVAAGKTEVDADDVAEAQARAHMNVASLDAIIAAARTAG